MAASTSLAFRIFATDNASATLRAVASSSDHLNQRLSVMSRAGAAMGVALKTGAAAGAAGLLAAGAVGLKTASNIEQAQIAFTTMLGSAQKANDFLQKLQKFAASTPFEFPDLVRSSQRLLAMGFAARDVIPTLTAIGDAVAGLGGSAEVIDQVTTAIGQMMAKGKIQSDELLQLTEAGIPALKILADSYGVTAAKMQDMVTKGQVLSGDAIPKLIKGIEQGTKSTAAFGGMMEKQSHTLAGLFSTLKDNVTSTLANLVTPAMPAIKSGLNQLNSAVQTVGPMLVSGLNSAIDAGQVAASSIGDVLHQALASDAANKVRSAWPVVQSTVVNGVRDLVGGVRDRAVEIGGGIFNGISTGIKTGNWSGLGQSLGSIAVTSLARGVDLAADFARMIGDAIEKIPWFDLALALGRQVPTLLAGLATGILNFNFGSLLQVLSDHLFEVLVGVLTLAFLPARIVGAVGQTLARVPLAGPLLRWAFEAITAFSKGLVGKIGEACSFIGRAFLDGFRRVFPEVGGAFARWLELLPTQLGVMAIRVAEKASAMIDGLGNGIKRRAGVVAAKIGEIVALILKPFASAGKWLIDAGANVVTGLIRGISNKISPLTGLAKSLGSKIVSAVGDLGRLLWDAGRQVIQGLIDGITSKLGELYNKVTSVGSNIKGKIKSVLGIHSPSTVMAELGRFTIAGFQQGMESQFPAASASLAGFASSLTTGPISAPTLTSSTQTRQRPSSVSSAASSNDDLVEALTTAFVRALGQARVQIDPGGLARVVRTGELMVARRA